MTISWRSARPEDMAECLSILPCKSGDRFIPPSIALDIWSSFPQHDAFFSAVYEANPTISGHRILGLGAAIFISSKFADAEISRPRPDANSRVLRAIHRGHPVIATRDEIAKANASHGIDVLVLGGMWRDHILSPQQRHEIQTLLISSFTECLAGYRVRRVLHEAADTPMREFYDASAEFQRLAVFPQHNRALYLMTAESIKSIPGSMANVIFSYRVPLLHLRKSDQQLLSAALDGATDTELSLQLGLSLAAVKARWRSTSARVAEIFPAIAAETEDRERGHQKRHLVLAYLRKHPEELRPYQWQTADS